jgi:hypothetical protein
MRCITGAHVQSSRRDRSKGSYAAALVGTAVFVPIFMLIANIALYFVEADVILWRGRSSISDKARNGTNILAAIAIALILWWLFALWSRRSTTAATVNAGVYGDLCEQLTDLSARIPDRPPCPTEPAAVAAYRQAIAHRDVIAADLGSTDGALRWVTGTGYTNAWKSIHRLQEALIIFDTPEEVIAGALRDEWRLKGSAIEQVDEVLTTLRYALTGFGLPPVPGMVPPLPPPSREQARALLSKVHYVIDEFRDTRREGLVRARNRLLGTGLMAGLSTNLLLAFVILALRDDPDQRMRIVTAGILFFVGAIIGLFNRLYVDGHTDTGVEDFGLSTARLISTPLASGLAAVFGVLISVLLPGVLDGVLPASSTLTTAPPTSAIAAPAPQATPTGASGQVAPVANPSAPITQLPAKTVGLGDVFDVQRYPFEVVLAAIFALTPGLLITRLQRQTDKFKADLTSTQASQQMTTPGR